MIKNTERVGGYHDPPTTIRGTFPTVPLFLILVGLAVALSTTSLRASLLATVLPGTADDCLSFAPGHASNLSPVFLAGPFVNVVAAESLAARERRAAIVQRPSRLGERNSSEAPRRTVRVAPDPFRLHIHDTRFGHFPTRPTTSYMACG